MSHHPACGARTDSTKACVCVSLGRPPKRPTSTNRPNSGGGGSRRPGGR